LIGTGEEVGGWVGGLGGSGERLDVNWLETTFSFKIKKPDIFGTFFSWEMSSQQWKKFDLGDRSDGDLGAYYPAQARQRQAAKLDP